MIQVEDTGKYPPNMPIDVVVATAGSGTRMTEAIPGLHKGLLPYRDAPILWTIVNEIPRDLNLAFLVGNLSAQVKSFCETAIADRAISFIEVDDWESARAGTSYSLLCAEADLNSNFWYVPCDGVFSGEVFDRRPDESTYFVKEVEAVESESYQTFELSDEGRVQESFFKEPRRAAVAAFTGVMWIGDKQEFFDGLRSSGDTEFAKSIGLGSKTEALESWIDLGNPDAYRHAVETGGEYDFSKPDELTFVLPDQVVKWFKDPALAEAKILKPKSNPAVYPVSVRSHGEFLGYAKVPGDSLYTSISPEKFRQLLEWLRKDLWRKSKNNISSSCELFYKEKTLSRVELIQPALGTAPYQFSSVDGIRVQTWRDYMGDFPFNELIDSPVPAEIHGDLQFDNIIEEAGTGNFFLIDWRPSFGKETVIGDLYYDLAKLLGGIRINYSEVKRSNFAIRDVDGGVSLQCPVSPHADELESILRFEVGEMGLDIARIELLVPLIYMNMAPLHTEPFARFLWAMALKGFALLK